MAGVKGDLVVQLVPEPLPALSTGSQDQELDVTQDEVPPHGAGTTGYDPEQEASAQGKERQQTQPKVTGLRVSARFVKRVFGIYTK